MNYIKDIDKNLFRAYDIRGIYPDTINEDVAYTIGLAYGTCIQKRGQIRCVVGYDNRLSSESLNEALIRGIRSTGADVISLGLVTTPMCYYAAIKLDVPSRIMITASHNPKDDNGFKFAYDSNGSVKGEEIEEFYQFIQEGNFLSGTGNLSTYDIKDEYFELFRNSLDFGPRKIKAVIDCANGTASIIAKEMYEQFPIDVVDIFCESDGTFPNHHPDPCVEENLESLKKKVIETGADIGIGFDGDGDRMGMVTKTGKFIPTDQFMIIVIRDIIDKVAKKEFLYDIKCSKSLSDEIEKLGAKGICYRTGAAYTKSRVLELDLPFGGELSGHVYFNERFPGFDSGLYAGLRMIEILSHTTKDVEDLLEGINHYYSTEELKFHSPDDKKFNIIKQIEEEANNRNYTVSTIDGMKVLFDDGWALVRASNTGPNITARFEANTEERLEEIKEEFTSLINQYNI